MTKFIIKKKEGEKMVVVEIDRIITTRIGKEGEKAIVELTNQAVMEVKLSDGTLGRVHSETLLKFAQKGSRKGFTDEYLRGVTEEAQKVIGKSA